MKLESLLLILVLFIKPLGIYADDPYKTTLKAGGSYCLNIQLDDNTYINVDFYSDPFTTSLKGKEYHPFCFESLLYGESNIRYYFYREENGKIYRFDPEEDIEYLMFDFTLNEGDYFTDFMGNEYVVESVKDTTIVQLYDNKNLGTFKQFELKGRDNPELNDTWLEGLGSIKNGLLYDHDVAGLQFFENRFGKSIRNLYYANTSSMLIHNIINTCDIKGTGAPHSDIQYKTANPIHSSVDLLKTGDIGYEFVGDSLHIVGYVWSYPKVSKPYMYLMCIVDDNHIALDYNIQTFGPQAYGQEPYIINVYFPGFKNGKYVISFPNASDVELDCDGNSPEFNYYITITEPVADYLNKFWTIQCFYPDDGDGKVMKTINFTDYVFDYNKKEDNIATFGEYSYVYYNDCHSPRTVDTHYYFREEDRKIYRYDKVSSTEYLAFDFNLSVGDPFIKHDGTEWEVYDKGLAKDISSYCSDFFPDRTMLKLREKGNESHEDIWIEGVGSIHTGILDANDVGTDSAYVESVYRIFSYDNKDCSFFNLDNCSYKSAIGKTYRLSAEDVVGDEFIKWDAGGRKIETCFIDDTLCIRDYKFTYADVNTVGALINGNHIDVYVNSAYPLSIAPDYLVRIDGKIPGFKSGEHTIHFPEGNQADTTLVCHGQVTDIQNISTPVFQQPTNTIYDLSGRRLTGIPEQGIYIQGGKKVIK